MGIILWLIGLVIMYFIIRVGVRDGIDSSTSRIETRADYKDVRQELSNLRREVRDLREKMELHHNP